MGKAPNDKPCRGEQGYQAPRSRAPRCASLAAQSLFSFSYFARSASACIQQTRIAPPSMGARALSAASALMMGLRCWYRMRGRVDLWRSTHLMTLTRSITVDMDTIHFRRLLLGQDEARAATALALMEGHIWRWRTRRPS